MNEHRTTTSPTELILKKHDDVISWIGPWDCLFNDLLDIFLGFCSTVGYGDISELKDCIYDTLNEEKQIINELKEI